MVSPSPRQPERFDTGGRVLGWVGLVCAVGLAVVWLTQLMSPLPIPVLAGAVLTALLFWSAIIRPAVSVDSEVLELRNMFETVRIPLAAVDELALRQFLVVRVGRRRYAATGVGRRTRSMSGRPGPRPGRAAARAGGLFETPTGGGTSRVVDAADLVESRLTELVADARGRADATGTSPDQAAVAGGVERHTTWYVVAPLGLALVLFVASFWL